MQISVVEDILELKHRIWQKFKNSNNKKSESCTIQNEPERGFLINSTTLCYDPAC